MDNKKLFLFKEFFSFIIFLLVVEIVISADEQFEACVPKNCGEGPNISYPFWINGTQNSSCGFPGYELFCKNKEPIIKMSGKEYIIRDMVYENQSFSVVKAGLSNDICSPSTYRLNFSPLRITYVPTSVNLSFFFNCTSLLSSEYSRYSLGCGTAQLRNLSVALFSHDPMLRYVLQSGQCETSATIPVDKLGNGSSLETSISREFISEILNKGFHLRWKASRCDECAKSGGRCGFDNKMFKFICLCTDRPHQRRCSPSGLLVGVGGVVGTIIVVCCLRKHSTTYSIWKSKKKAHRVVEEFLKNNGSLAPKRYNYSNIKKITSSFKDKIGQGGYGGVYKGKLLDGRLVAVTLLDKAKGEGEEFINEVVSISRTSHINVVTLLGFCFDGSKRALIYEFMINGSMEKFIDCPNTLEASSQLGWEKLYQIVTGVARGLEYLHRGCNTRILHFDIKPQNILLDKDFTPKISDFGLARLCSKEESIISMFGTRGTVGYIAPEVFSRNFGGVSHKSDVYSYGMMVLEIVGQRKSINVGVDHTSEIYFPQWIYKRLELIEDLGLEGTISNTETKITKKLILVALWCVQTNPMDRPGMSRVVEMLEAKHEILPIPPKPCLFPLARSPVNSSSA
ncbi:hypothetical protein AQUCO_04100056v1 [Aquilegia coerulea]|uniref:Protein kinase domain-containing protein n=1 Tax=Aquilegia coerulea TaxID=218851 RepID=A0A2G5CQ32_AQUCA|nr:hypothetical protein AQUCO_04100056v1 [Aquilegia coerulea]